MFTAVNLILIKNVQSRIHDVFVPKAFFHFFHIASDVPTSCAHIECVNARFHGIITIMHSFGCTFLYPRWGVAEVDDVGAI